MGGSAGEDMILSYNDTVLRRSDLDILSEPHYLNDRLIEFYFSYLSSIYPSDDIYLVPPSIAFWLQNCSDEESLKSFIVSLNLPAKKLVAFPVNNNEDVTLVEGGSHWTLLVFDRVANVFVHHDSLHGSNSLYSKRLFTSVVGFMGSTDADIQYQDYQSSPQQKNGYDCGLFVTAIARVICNWYTSSDCTDRGDLWFSEVKEQVTPATVSNMRSEILALIKGLMAAGRCISMRVSHIVTESTQPSIFPFERPKDQGTEFVHCGIPLFPPSKPRSVLGNYDVSLSFEGKSVIQESTYTLLLKISLGIG